MTAAIVTTQLVCSNCNLDLHYADYTDLPLSSWKTPYCRDEDLGVPCSPVTRHNPTSKEILAASADLKVPASGAFRDACKLLTTAQELLRMAVADLPALPAPADLKCCSEPRLQATFDGLIEANEVDADEDQWSMVDGGWDSLHDEMAARYMICTSCHTPFAAPADLF